MAFDFEMETKNPFYNVNFKWTIENFSRLASSVESPAFCPIPGFPYKWAMLLEFKPVNGNNQMAVSFRSLDEEGSFQPIRMSGHIGFMNKSNFVWKENFFSIVITSTSVVECFRIPNECMFPLPLMIGEYFLFLEDVVVVRCCMSVSGILTSVINKNECPCPETENILNVVYKRNSHTDFTFHFTNGEIRAHKAILSARSPVFQKMFEQEQSSTTIEGFELCLFDCFIGFLYTRTIKEDVKPNFEVILKLHELSDKYKVKDLQRYCSNVLVSSYLNVNTVIRILKSACSHSDSSLTANAMEFIHHRLSEVIMTEEWKAFLTEYTGFHRPPEVLYNFATTSSEH